MDCKKRRTSHWPGSTGWIVLLRCIHHLSGVETLTGHPNSLRDVTQHLPCPYRNLYFITSLFLSFLSFFWTGLIHGTFVPCKHVFLLDVARPNSLAPYPKATIPQVLLHYLPFFPFLLFFYFPLNACLVERSSIIPDVRFRFIFSDIKIKPFSLNWMVFYLYIAHKNYFVFRKN